MFDLYQGIGRRKFPFGLVLLAVAALWVAGCASGETPVPVTGSHSKVTVHEYALVEQSMDNPTHPEFQQRVPAAVAAKRQGFLFNRPADAVNAPNQALAAFGYRLEPSSTPPFSGYVLYHDDALVQQDIARFWPVSVKTEQKSDFVLSFETMDGARLFASQDGIRPWPGTSTSAGSTPPVYYNGQLAYAAIDGGMVNVYAGGGLLYSGEDVSPSDGASQNAATADANSERDLITWGGHHWALALPDRVVVDGKDLRPADGGQVFGFQLIGGEPFYFYNSHGQVRLNYAGHDLPYIYDQVVHGNTGDTAMFNPGGNERLVWFYALRDGLWYYVEVGQTN